MIVNGDRMGIVNDGDLHVVTSFAWRLRLRYRLGLADGGLGRRLRGAFGWRLRVLCLRALLTVAAAGSRSPRLLNRANTDRIWIHAR